jgi:uracil-DNA glycosylase
MDSVDRLVEQLTRTPISGDAFNQYAADSDPNNAARRSNLSLYLRQLLERRADVLLLGEAPSYRGCRLTGVPMTSRTIMLKGIEPLGLFGEARGYRNTVDSGFEDIQREQTATIAWGTLTARRFVPVIWGAFPFHPYEPGEPRSNRLPRRDEIEMGLVFVQQLVDLFRFKRVVAVGNVGDGALTKLNIPHTKIRHPSHGGKHAFVQGIDSILADG